MQKQTLGLMVLTATAVFALSTYGEIDWAEARIMGTTTGGKMFYAPSEEMNFTLKLENVRGELPSDTYFIDWTRTGDDGKKDGGRVSGEDQRCRHGRLHVSAKHTFRALQ